MPKNKVKKEKQNILDDEDKRRDISDKNLQKLNKRDKRRRSFADFPYLAGMKPKERYVFHSDYFDIDNGVGCVLSFFHTEGSTDNFGAFWGINRIPSGLPDGVSVISLEQTRRLSEKWLIDHQARAEQISELNSKEQGRGGTMTSKGKAGRKQKDLAIIAEEIQNGASYLHVQYRMLVKAPNVDILDDALKKIDRLYIDRFATITVGAYNGDQRDELSMLFMKNDMKQGKGYHFTSTELAGSYSLVTHGLEDVDGEYIGYMVGDVNNSAVIFNTNRYKHHVVIANDDFDSNAVPGETRIHVPDLWGSKLSQSCLLNNHRVVHVILDGADLDKLGPKFSKLTKRIDMNTGDVNMFEMFGEVDDELSIFPSQMQKLILMAEQAYQTTDSDRSIIRSSLEDVATKFYIDNRMWRENAVANRDKLRVTGIPHEEVPKLEMFVSYLDTEYKKLVNASAKDPERVHAMSVLASVFKNLLANNGDLFNTITNPEIDGAKRGRRVIYDFSKLMLRGKGIAMAQLVNIIGFAVGNLGDGDSVIIHGADLIDNGVKDYIMMQFGHLHEKGGRVVYLYNSTDYMLSDLGFSSFDRADYLILGNMTENMVSVYQKKLGQEIPADLARLITQKGENVCYIRRGFDNVIFRQDLSLGISGKVAVR